MGRGQARFGLAFLLPGPVQWKGDGGSWAEALSMYIYTRLHPPARPGAGGLGRIQCKLSYTEGRLDEDGQRRRREQGPRARHVEAKKGLASHAGHQAEVGEPGVTSPHPGLAL